MRRWFKLTQVLKSAFQRKAHLNKGIDPHARSGATTMRTKSLTSEQMEARVARFKKLQTYQRQNFETHNIPPGAVEKVTARRVYPVMAPADYEGRSVGA